MARRLLLKQNTLDGYPNPSEDYSFIGYQGPTFSERFTNSTSPIFQDRTPGLSEVLNNSNLVGDNSINFGGYTASIQVFKRVVVDDIELYTTELKKRYVVNPDIFIDENPESPTFGQNSSWVRFSQDGIELGAIENSKILAIGEALENPSVDKSASKLDWVSLIGIETAAIETYSNSDYSTVFNSGFRISILGVEAFFIQCDETLNPIISIRALTFSNSVDAMSAGLTAGNLYIEASTGVIKMII